MDVIVTPKEAEKRFREFTTTGKPPLCARTICNMCAAGELVHIKIGKRYYVNLTKSFPDIDWAPREDVTAIKEQEMTEKGKRAC